MSQIQMAGMSWYTKADYPGILDVMEDYHLLPDSFEDWLKKAEEAEVQFMRRGMKIIRVIIDPKTFPAWCKARGLNINAQARMAFANEEAARQVRKGS